MDNYQTHIIGAWLRACGYSISSSKLKIELLSHPDYPHLNSITESLHRLGVDATALRVEKALLAELEGNFLVYMVRDGIPMLAMVKNLYSSDNSISIAIDKGKSLQLSRSEFKEQWNGVVVAIDEQKRSISDRMGIVKPFMAAAILVMFLITCFFEGRPELWTSIHFLLSLVGIVVCAMIVAHEFGSSIADKFCAESKHTSCDAVLNSRVGRLFFGVGISDVGIVYFSTMIIYWMMTSVSGSLTTAVSGATIITLLTIPFTLFSVTYQGLVVKKFCPLCLSVVTVLWLQVMVLISFTDRAVSNFSIGGMVLISCIGLFLFLLWIMVKPLLKLPSQNGKLQLESVTFRRSYQLFLPWYNSATVVALGEMPDVHLGNPDAPLKLLIISNPMCGPCAAAHQVYEQLMRRYPGKIQLVIRFYVPLEDCNDPRMVVAARLVELSIEQDGEFLPVAINQWYNAQDYHSWIQMWGRSRKTWSANVLISHKVWCRKNGIDQTPTLLVNGKMMPTFYHPMDFASFVEPLIQQMELQNQNTKAKEGSLT